MMTNSQTHSLRSPTAEFFREMTPPRRFARCRTNTSCCLFTIIELTVIFIFISINSYPTFQTEKGHFYRVEVCRVVIFRLRANIGTIMGGPLLYHHALLKVAGNWMRAAQDWSIWRG